MGYRRYMEDMPKDGRMQQLHRLRGVKEEISKRNGYCLHRQAHIEREIILKIIDDQIDVLVTEGRVVRGQMLANIRAGRDWRENE